MSSTRAIRRSSATAAGLSLDTKRCDLRDTCRAGVRDELCGERRTDPALLILVGDGECDLRSLGRCGRAGRSRPARIALDVGDERMPRAVDRGELTEIRAAEARLRPVESGAARLLAEALEHRQHRADVAVAQRPHEQRRPRFGSRTRVCMTTHPTVVVVTRVLRLQPGDDLRFAQQQLDSVFSSSVTPPRVRLRLDVLVDAEDVLGVVRRP